MKTESGQIAARMTDAKPIETVSRIALTGTPRAFVSSTAWGASPRRASANSIREPV